MTSAIFLDANVPIYASGREHPLKAPCGEVLEFAVRRPGNFFTDAEVLQELMHRYLALRSWPVGKGVLQRFARAMRDHVEPVHAYDVEAAALLADRYTGLRARDLLHIAIMIRVGADTIITADRAFGGVPHIRRLDPGDRAAWRGQVESG